MRGPPVVLTPTLGRPVTNVISERGAVPMTVVNTLGEPVTLVAQGGEPVTLFNPNGTLWDYPFSLFSNNEQGAWYDPSDFSTLYQDSTGTTPVTAVEQPVGLMLDRSRGLVLGAELNGDPTLTGNGFWGANAGVTVGSGKVSYVSTSVGNALFKTGSFLTVGKTYTVSITVANYVAGAVGVETDAPQNALAIGNGTFTFIVRAISGAFYITARNATTTLDVTNISVRELPGNHASQSSSASRPILRARYNLLTYTEDFGNAAWSKILGVSVGSAVLDPNGGMTATRLIFPSIANGERFDQVISAPVGTGRCEIWMRGIGQVRLADTAMNVETKFTLTDTWTLYSITGTRSSATATFRIIWRSSDTAITELDVWRPQANTAADQTATGGAYQRVGAATDYDTSNPVWRPYLAFDGSDDSMSTASIDFSGTDEVTVFAGVTRLSSTSTGILTELSTSVTSNNGSFAIVDRGLLDATTNGDYGIRSRGTTTVSVAGTTLTVPTTSVLTMLSDISAPSLSLAVNGAAYASSASTQGTGNFGNYPLFIGRRNNTSNPFNGRLYSLAVLGRTATAAELGAMESWVNGKTGAY